KGISKSGDVIDIAAKDDIIQKSGSWFAYNGEKIGQGRENAKKYLEEHPDVMEEVVAKVKQAHGIGIKAEEAKNNSKADSKADGKTDSQAKAKAATGAADSEA
ncbi:MAG: DNA recombination/repair protein RecA, partial [Clostridia bacterium]|nr:DNA recombination/repair protein RecA [Clostridia bacterium]